MAQQAVIDLLPDVAQICRQAPTPTLIAAYVRAARQFCLESRWLQVGIDGVTTASTKAYNLGSDTYAEIFGVKGITLYEDADSPVFLTEDGAGGWDPAEDAAVPQAFAYLPEAQVALHPTPDAAYDMTIAALIAPKRGATSIDSRLITRWEYALQDGALAYLFGLPDVPWTNPQLGELHAGKFRAAIGQAAEIAALGFNTGNSPLRTGGVW